MKTQNAFTIIELMIAVALAAILMATALPNLRYLLLNNRVTTKTNEFIGVVNFVRSEAITRSKRVEIQPLDESGNPTASAEASNEWGTGWQVWVDFNGNGVAEAEEIVKKFEFPKDGITIDATPDDKYPIRYNNKGRVAGLDQTLVLNVCVKNRKPGEPAGRQIQIDRNTGRVSLENRYLDGACMPATAP